MKRILEKQIETGNKIIKRSGVCGQLDMSLNEMRELIQRLGQEGEVYGTLHDTFLFGLAVGYRAGRRGAAR